MGIGSIGGAGRPDMQRVEAAIETIGPAKVRQDPIGVAGAAEAQAGGAGGPTGDPLVDTAAEIVRRELEGWVDSDDVRQAADQLTNPYMTQAQRDELVRVLDEDGTLEKLADGMRGLRGTEERAWLETLAGSGDGGGRLGGEALATLAGALHEPDDGHGNLWRMDALGDAVARYSTDPTRANFIVAMAERGVLADSFHSHEPAGPNRFYDVDARAVATVLGSIDNSHAFARALEGIEQHGGLPSVIQASIDYSFSVMGGPTTVGEQWNARDFNAIMTEARNLTDPGLKASLVQAIADPELRTPQDMPDIFALGATNMLAGGTRRAASFGDVLSVLRTREPDAASLARLLEPMMSPRSERLLGTLVDHAFADLAGADGLDGALAAGHFMAAAVTAADRAGNADYSGGEAAVGQLLNAALEFVPGGFVAGAFADLALGQAISSLEDATRERVDAVLQQIFERAGLDGEEQLTGDTVGTPLGAFHAGFGETYLAARGLVD